MDNIVALQLTKQNATTYIEYTVIHATTNGGLSTYHFLDAFFYIDYTSAGFHALLSVVKLTISNHNQYGATHWQIILLGDRTDKSNSMALIILRNLKIG